MTPAIVNNIIKNQQIFDIFLDYQDEVIRNQAAITSLSKLLHNNQKHSLTMDSNFTKFKVIKVFKVKLKNKEKRKKMNLLTHSECR